MEEKAPKIVIAYSTLTSLTLVNNNCGVSQDVEERYKQHTVHFKSLHFRRSLFGSIAGVVLRESLVLSRFVLKFNPEKPVPVLERYRWVDVIVLFCFGSTTNKVKCHHLSFRIERKGD